MSATIDADMFLNFFPGSVLENVSGREHEMLILYRENPPEENSIVETILQTHLCGSSGKSELSRVTEYSIKNIGRALQIPILPLLIFRL